MLADYQEQLGKAFEHGTRLKKFIVKQPQLNGLLDLGKGERQVAPEAAGEPEAVNEPPAPVRAAAWQSRETLRQGLLAPKLTAA
jgi:hypothetical protein